MSNPNYPYNHNRRFPSRTVRTLGFLALTVIGIGSAYLFPKSAQAPGHNRVPIVRQWTLGEIHGIYPAVNDVLRIDPNNAQDRLLIVGATQSKVGDDIFLTTDGGKDWTEVAPDADSGITTGQYVVDAQFAPGDGKGGQVFEITREATKGDEVSVQVGDITSDGTVLTNTASAEMDISSTHGSWTRQADGSWYFTLWADKGGGPQVEDLGLSEPVPQQ